jgi:hypothetical protein
MHPKITPEHLGRGAVVYIRQSTVGQVTEHTESQRRQYALADSARAYGFASVTCDRRRSRPIRVWIGRASRFPEIGGFSVLRLRWRRVLHRGFPSCPQRS